MHYNVYGGKGNKSLHGLNFDLLFPASYQNEKKKKSREKQIKFERVRDRVNR